MITSYRTDMNIPSGQIMLQNFKAHEQLVWSTNTSLPPAPGHPWPSLAATGRHWPPLTTPGRQWPPQAASPPTRRFFGWIRPSFKKV